MSPMLGHAVSTSRIQRGILYYLCLQATRQGQASYAHVNEIVAGLRELGWTVELFEPAFSHGTHVPGAAGRLAEFLRIQLQLWVAIMRQRPDRIYIRSHFAAFPTAALAWLLRIPVVQEVNGPYDDIFIAWPWTRRFKPVFIWLSRSQLRWARSVVVVTAPYREWITKQIGAKRVEVISNAANTDLFRPGATSSIQLPPRFALFFGALAEWQGIGTLLQAIHHPAWPDGVCLVVIGEGVEKSRIEAAAARSSKIQYLGSRPYMEMPAVIGSAMISLSPQTDLKGRARLGLFPLKVFESLACGVPVLVTDYPGQADIVRQHECGWVIPADDPAALAGAVAACAADPVEAFSRGERGRSAVVREHSWRARAAQTDQLLRSLE